jgi:hypothetical protein
MGLILRPFDCAQGRQAQHRYFDFAQHRYFDFAQHKYFDFAQHKYFDFAQHRLSERLLYNRFYSL